MNLEDAPIIGQIVTALSLLLDMALASGDFLIALIWVAVTNVEIVLSIVVTANRLAENVAFLPANIVQQAATATFAAMLIVYIGRLVSQIGESENETQT